MKKNRGEGMNEIVLMLISFACIGLSVTSILHAYGIRKLDLKTDGLRNELKQLRQELEKLQ